MSHPGAAAQALFPSRLNLSVARRCFVSCPGCYSVFGEGEPDIAALLKSVSVFVDLGITDVTLSGGDPLTIRDLDELLDGLRRIGVRAIKLDTVGTALLAPAQVLARDDEPIVPRRDVGALLNRLDQIAIPLDGVSNDSVAQFRAGRASLFDETTAILEALTAAQGGAEIMINTVAHARNRDEFPAIAALLAHYRGISLWNIFQYTPTDQARGRANARFALSDEAFAALERELSRTAPPKAVKAAFWSNKARLGAYLLVNSDGDCWAPDARGETVRLGNLFGRELDVLRAWRDVAQAGAIERAAP